MTKKKTKRTAVITGNETKVYIRETVTYAFTVKNPRGDSYVIAADVRKRFLALDSKARDKHSVSVDERDFEVQMTGSAASFSEDSLLVTMREIERGKELLEIPRYRIVHESSSGPFGPHDGDTRTIKYVSGGKDYAGRVVNQKFEGDAKSGGWVDIDYEPTNYFSGKTGKVVKRL